MSLYTSTPIAGTFLVFSLCTCSVEETRLVHFSHEQFQSDDGIDDNHEEDKQRNVEQWDHGLDDRVQHHL